MKKTFKVFIRPPVVIHGSYFKRDDKSEIVIPVGTLFELSGHRAGKVESHFYDDKKNEFTTLISAIDVYDYELESFTSELRGRGWVKCSK